MVIVQVYIKVKEADIEAFKKATVINASESAKEQGIARFDFLQQADDPAAFLLTEVYLTSEDTLKHKETRHYREWRDTVEPMMAEPRRSVKFFNVYPDELGWD